MDKKPPSYRPRAGSKIERVWVRIQEQPGMGISDLHEVEPEIRRLNSILRGLKERRLIRVEYDERGWRHFHPVLPPVLPF